MEKIKSVARATNKGLARLYNSLHPKLKIILMVWISILVAGFLTLFMNDLTVYNATVVNDYVKLFIDSLFIPLTILTNVVQQWSVEQGTKLLAMQNDPATIDKLNSKIDEINRIKALAN